MKSKIYLGVILTVTLLSGSVLAAAKDHKSKVTMEEAQAIALKRFPGATVESSTAGKKDYSIEILRADNIKTDVFVSEKNGKIKKVIDQ